MSTTKKQSRLTVILRLENRGSETLKNLYKNLLFRYLTFLDIPHILVKQGNSTLNKQKMGPSMMSNTINVSKRIKIKKKQ